MASPTWAEVWAPIANAVEILDELDNFCNTNSPNLLGLIDDYVQSLEGDYVTGGLGGIGAIRAALSGTLSPASCRALLEPSIREAGRLIAAPETDIPAIMSRLYDYMITNSKTLNRREFVYGSPSAGGSNVGNGTIIRCTVDEEDQPIEATHAELRTAKCVRDARQVDEHQEEFEFYGVEAEPDYCQVLGSGQAKKVIIRATDAVEVERYLGNPSFSDFAGTVDSAGNTTSITHWTSSDITKTDVVTAQTYRDYVGDPGPRAVHFTADVTLSQIVQDTIRARLSPNNPYWLQVAVFPTTGTSGGNIVIRMGATSRTVALAGLNLNAWNIVSIIATPDKSCWLEEFNEADLDIKLEIESLAGGTGIYVDDVIFAPFKRFNNLWYLVVPNAAVNTPWLRDDIFTFTDSIAADSKIQTWLWRAGLGYLPSVAGGTETEADP